MSQREHSRNTGLRVNMRPMGEPDRSDNLRQVQRCLHRGLYSEVDDLVPYPIVMCDEETSVAAAERVMHKKGLQATVKFILNVRWVNGITST